MIKINIKDNTTALDDTIVTYNKIVAAPRLFYRLSLLCLGELCHCFGEDPMKPRHGVFPRLARQ